MTGRVLGAMLDDLRKIGVREGDCLIVHSSFRSLGLADASPTDVIRTLIEAVGQSGTLMMPTFTYCYAGIWNVRPYNPGTTPSRFMGILAETLRSYPGALRSGSPTYSVAAFGAHAESLTAGRENVGGLGAGSSFEDAYRLGARILLIGVGSNRNSTIHYAEHASGLPVCDIPYRAFWGRTALLERDGGAVEIPLTDFPGCSTDFGAADEYLVEKDLMTHGMVCSAGCLFMKSRDVVDAIAARLRQTPDWLFCNAVTCEPCTLRRRRLQERGLI
jgi:aminoglycoside 3-N-acetyltransferase